MAADLTVVTGRPPVAVIGIGNRMRGDDGLGPAAIDLLAGGPDLPAGTVETIVLDGEPTRLVDAWDQRRLAVVVDAIVTGERPGTAHRFEVGPEGEGESADDELPVPRAGPSSHGAGPAEAVALGRVLGRLPARLVFIGLEPAVLDLNPQLSPPVRSALPGLLTMIRSELQTIDWADSDG